MTTSQVDVMTGSGGGDCGTVRNRERLVDANGRRSYAPVDRIDSAFECGGLIYHATTNEAGRYEISGLPTGTCAPRLRPVVGRYWMPHQPEVQMRDLATSEPATFMPREGHPPQRLVIR